MSLYFCTEVPLKSQLNDKLSAAFLKSKKWLPGDTIRVRFLPPNPEKQQATFTPIVLMKKRKKANGDPSEIDPIEYDIRGDTPEEAVKKVVKERIEPICNLRFVFTDSDNSDVRIRFESGGGSWSLVGTDCKSAKPNEPTMNFAWIDASVIMHEFGHVLGMIHEHSNPNGNPIEWNKEKLYALMKKTQNWDKKQVDINIIDRYKSDQLNASEFDPASIMLYFFPPELTLNNKGTDINQKLSEIDIEYISREYGSGTTRGGGSGGSGSKNVNLYVVIPLGIILGVLIVFGLLYLKNKKRY